MIRCMLSALMAMMIWTPAVFAQSSKLGATVKLGTLGLGAEVTVGLNEKLNLRVGINGLTVEDIVEDDAEGDEVDEITSELNLFTAGALLDFYPGPGSFRFTAGLLLNNNEITATADPNDVVEINETEYLVSDVTGEVTFNAIAPYLGLGWGNAVADGRWHWAFDLGVMFQGAPDVSLAATATDPALQAALDADIAIELEDFEDEVEAFIVWPVLSMGASLHF